MEKHTPAEIRRELGNCTGTRACHRYFRCRLTDDALLMAELCEAFWLLDIIVSCQAEREIGAAGFQSRKLTAEEKPRTGPVVCTGSNGKEIAREELDCTGFPLPEGIEVWKENGVIFLPSEY